MWRAKSYYFEKSEKINKHDRLYLSSAVKT